MLVLVEDVALGELLSDAVNGAGHRVALHDLASEPAPPIDYPLYDAMLVDLDTRAPHGETRIREARRASPQTRVVALLRCAAIARGAPGDAVSPLPYDVGLPKPARLSAILAALDGARAGADALA